jgi:putative flippase GtrA
MLKHFMGWQFAAFLSVGVTAALFHWTSRILLSQFMSYSWAVVFAYVVAMTIAFLLNSYYVFPGSDKPARKQARDFFFINIAFFPIVLIASLAFNRALIQFGVSKYSEEFAHALAIIIPLPATFLLYKLLAFKERYYG